MRITDVDPDRIPPDDDRWENARTSPWPAMGYLLVLAVLIVGIGLWWADR